MEPPALDNTYRPMKSLPSDSKQPSRTRFTLHRILSAVTAIAFAISKFIVSLHEATFASGLFDVVLATLGAILFVSCWYKPNLRLQWLFDTDWDYLLDVTAWRCSSILRLTRALAEIAKKNTSTILSILLWTFSVMFAFVRGIRLFRGDLPNGVVEFFSVDCVFLALIFLNMALVIVGGDEHQRNTRTRALVDGLAILAQLGFLASWTMLVSSLSSPDEYKFPTWTAVLFLTALMEMVTFYLGDSTGHFDRLLDAKAVNLVWTSYGLVCVHVALGGITKHLLNKRGDPNYHRDLAIIIGFGVFATLLLGFRIYCYSREYVSFAARSLARWLRAQQ